MSAMRKAYEMTSGGRSVFEVGVAYVLSTYDIRVRYYMLSILRTKKQKNNTITLRNIDRGVLGNLINASSRSTMTNP